MHPRGVGGPGPGLTSGADCEPSIREGCLSQFPPMSVEAASSGRSVLASTGSLQVQNQLNQCYHTEKNRRLGFKMV